MGVSERLYETACECRDLETRLDRLTRELRDREEELAAHFAAEGALLSEIDGSSDQLIFSKGVTDALASLRNLSK